MDTGKGYVEEYPLFRCYLPKTLDGSVQLTSPVRLYVEKISPSDDPFGSESVIGRVTRPASGTEGVCQGRDRVRGYTPLTLGLGSQCRRESGRGDTHV